MKDEHSAQMLSIVKQYQQVKQQGRLLMLEFTSLVDYLHLLRACSLALDCMGNQASLYLAAAVSDFYIPKDKLVGEHNLVVVKCLFLVKILCLCQTTVPII